MRSAAPFTAQAQFRIAANHPALPGHFPGAPLVPGVLLLAEGLQHLETQCGRAFRCRRIAGAKFLHPVAPEDTVTVSLSFDAAGHASVDFQVGTLLVALATMEFSPPAQEPAHA